MQQKRTEIWDKIHSWKDIGPLGPDTADCLGWRRGEWAKSRLWPNLPWKQREKLVWNTCELRGRAETNSRICVRHLCRPRKAYAPRQVSVMRSALSRVVNYRWEQTGQHGRAERGERGRKSEPKRTEERRGEEAPSRCQTPVWTMDAEHYLTLWTQSPVATSRGDAPGSSPESLTWWCTCSKHRIKRPVH